MSIKSQYGLDRNVDTTEAVALEHDLTHLLAVLEGVHRGLSQEDLATTGVDLELFEEGEVPEVLHVVPVPDDTILHRIRYLKHGAGGSSLISTHDVLDDQVAGVGALFFATQDRPADHRGELVLGEVLGGIANLEETGASIKDYRVRSILAECLV